MLRRLCLFVDAHSCRLINCSDMWMLKLGLGLADQAGGGQWGDGGS